MNLNVPIQHVALTEDELLALAAAGTLIPGMWYWVTDATPEGPLWAYAESTTNAVPSPPANRLVQSVATAGYPVVLSYNDQAPLGTLQAWTDSDGDPVVALIGSSNPYPQDVWDLDHATIVAGQTVGLVAAQVEIYLPGAEAGGTLGVSSVDGDMATVSAIPKPTPAYSVSASSAADVTIPPTDTWTPVVTGVPSDFPTTQAFVAGDSVLFGLHINSKGDIGGSVDIGFEKEDPVGDPGVWIAPTVSFNILIAPGASTLYTRQVQLQGGFDSGLNLRLSVKANATAGDVNLGSWDHAGGTLVAVAAGEFRSDAAKIKDTTALRFAVLNDQGEDKEAALGALTIGSSLTTYHAGVAMVGVISAVTVDSGNHVDVDLSSITNEKSNWSGSYTFSGVLSSSAFDPVVQGTIYAQNFTISQPASGGGGGASKWPLTIVTGDRDIAVADDQTELVCDSASAINLTMDAGLPVNFQCIVTRNGAGTVTITPDASDLLNGAASALNIVTQYQDVRIVRTS